MRDRTARWLTLATLFLLAASPAAAAADPAAAERQYRVARRLAAEGSPEAAAALQAVVRLAPEGPLADDAIVDEALLTGLPMWPEELGRLSPAAVARAATLLGRVADGMPSADRAPEATYRRALLRLEPLPGRDAGAARIDLLAVASNPAAGSWGAAARALMGRLAEAAGDVGRARDAWYRVIVDAPGDPAWPRAAAGLGRLAARAGRPDDAAHWYEGARRSGMAGESESRGLELAVRRLLGTRPAGSARPVVTAVADVRATALAVAPNGDLAVADRRAGQVRRLSEGGREADRWMLGDVTALTFDPDGRLFAASGDRVLRLPSGGGPIDVGGQGELGPASALAAGPFGVVWVLGRRGETIGRLDPGDAVARPVWDERGRRLTALAWDGRRLVAGDTRADAVVAIEPPSPARPLGGELARIGAVAADASGRVAAIDQRAATVVLLDADGRALGVVDLASIGIERPEAIGFDGAGRLHVWDDGDTTWTVLP